MFIYYGLHLRGVVNKKTRANAMFLVTDRNKNVVFHVFHSNYYGGYEIKNRDFSPASKKYFVLVPGFLCADRARKILYSLQD